MEKIALKIGGLVFVLIGIMHAFRVVMKLPVTVGEMVVPLSASIVLAIITFVLGLWMLKIACCCCKK